MTGTPLPVGCTEYDRPPIPLKPSHPTATADLLSTSPYVLMSHSNGLTVAHA